MSWKVVPVNRIAHITPTQAHGSATTDFPVFNISTPDPNIVCSFGHTDGNSASFRWDRGAAGNFNEVNCCAIINHNLGSKDMTWTLYDDNVAGGTGRTLATSSPTTNADIFVAFSVTSTLRHLTLIVDKDSAGAAYSVRIGCFVAGFYYDLGGHPLGSGSTSPYSNAANMQASMIGVPHFSGYSEGGRTISRDFRVVTHTDAQALVRLMARHWDATTGDQTIDGIGGGGGKNPVVVVDDDGLVYYGPCQVSATQIAPVYDSVTLTMQTIPHWGID